MGTAFIGSYSASPWGWAKILGENLLILKLNWSVCLSEVKFIHVSFHILWCTTFRSVLDQDLIFISLFFLRAWSNVLTFHQSLTRQGFGSCAGSPVRLHLQEWICPGWAKPKEQRGLKGPLVSPEIIPAPPPVSQAWWALQHTVLFPKCCVEEWITSWMLLQRSAELKSWILAIPWTVLLLGTSLNNRQTNGRESHSEDKSVRRCRKASLQGKPEVLVLFLNREK